MTKGKPIACSLGADALEQRLAAIAEIGADSLVSREAKGDQHLLRFRSSDGTRQRLEGIVAAEAECCSFLDLSLTEEGGELILSIAAPEAGQSVAVELAGTFAGKEEVSNEKTPGRSGVWMGASGFLLALCCVALPVAFGVTIGAVVGGVLDAIAAVLVMLGIVLVLRRRRAGKCQRC